MFPKQVAQLPKAVEAPKVVPGPVRTFSTKEQKHFVEEAHTLAAELGFSGDPNAVLHDVRVEDAQNYLVKIFHEVHQSALTPERDTPTAESVCEHLGITDADELVHVAQAIEAAYERELSEAPQNPTAVTHKGVVNMEAKLEADVTHLMQPGSI